MVGLGGPITKEGIGLVEKNVNAFRSAINQAVR